MHLITLLTVFLALGLSPLAFAKTCEEAGGYQKNGKCYCRTGDKSLDPNKASDVKECEAAAVKKVEAGLTDVIKNFKTETCSTCVAASAPSNSALACPDFLKNRLLSPDDEKQSWFGTIKSPKEICQALASDKTLKTAEDLERFLASKDGFKIGATQNLLTGESCIPKTGVNENDRKAVVAEYYYSMHKLKNGELGAIESIASIDSLLGTRSGKLLDGVACDDKTVAESGMWCKTLQACSVGATATGSNKQQDFSEMVGELRDQVIPAVKQLNEKKKEAQKRLGELFKFSEVTPSDEHTENVKQVKEEIERIEFAIGNIETMYPVIRAEQFAPYLDKAVAKYDTDKQKTTQLLSEGLEKQLTEDRGRLIHNLKRFQDATHCINPDLRESTCQHYDETVASAPEFARVSSNKTNKDERLKTILANNYLDRAACRREAREIRDGYNTTMRDFLINEGLTIATAGIFSGASLARGATTLFKGGVNLAKVPAQAQAVTLTKATIWGDRVLKIANIGVNTGFAVWGYSYAVDECDHLLHGLSPAVGSKASAPNCPKDSYRGPHSVGTYKQCVIAKSLAVGLGALPFAPAIAKLAKNTASVVKGAGKNADEVGSIAARERTLAKTATNTTAKLPDNPRLPRATDDFDLATIDLPELSQGKKTMLKKTLNLEDEINRIDKELVAEVSDPLRRQNVSLNAVEGMKNQELRNIARESLRGKHSELDRIYSKIDQEKDAIKKLEASFSEKAPHANPKEIENIENQIKHHKDELEKLEFEASSNINEIKEIDSLSVKLEKDKTLQERVRLGITKKTEELRIACPKGG